MRTSTFVAAPHSARRAGTPDTNEGGAESGVVVVAALLIALVAPGGSTGPGSSISACLTTCVLQ